MQSIYKIIITALPVLIAASAFSQEKTFDIITYTSPKGWTEQQGQGNISYLKTDGGNQAQIAIYKHRSSEGNIQTDFDKDWNELVATGKNISAPEKTPPQTEKEWTTISGSTVWQYNGSNVATMLTVYSNKKICVALLCNATAMPYLKEYQTMLASLHIDAGITKQPELPASIGKENENNIPTVTNSLVGIWANNLLETSGYINGMPMYTAGYFRREYKFNADGSYLFLYKTWSAYMKPIMFGYETGAWSATGNEITITPKQGKNEEWNKAASGKSSEWGSRIKSLNNKAERIRYRYELKYYSGSKDYALILYFDKPTEREGTAQNQLSYSKRTDLLIDLPPGTTIISEVKNATAATTAPTALNTALAGKIWEGTRLEKTGYGTMQMNTGGFFSSQYIFYADGRYQFIDVGASAFTNTKMLKYETGTYLIKGDQLTITPGKGADEEWSITGKTSNGNSDMNNRKILETWNKKIKTSVRKLETYTYTFRIEYMTGNKTNALILQRTRATIREGNGNNESYYFETLKNKSVIVPPGFK